MRHVVLSGPETGMMIECFWVRAHYCKEVLKTRGSWSAQCRKYSNRKLSWPCCLPFLSKSLPLQLPRWKNEGGKVGMSARVCTSSNCAYKSLSLSRRLRPSTGGEMGPLFCSLLTPSGFARLLQGCKWWVGVPVFFVLSDLVLLMQSAVHIWQMYRSPYLPVFFPHIVQLVLLSTMVAMYNIKVTVLMY